MSFHGLQVSFESIYYAFAQKPSKLFWARLNKVGFAFAGKRLKHLESRETLCVHHPKSLNALNLREYKKFYRTDPLFVQKRNLSSVHVDKLINIEREWTDVASRYLSTGSEPRPNCAPRVVTCITSHGDLEGTMEVFRNSTSLHSLPWWKKVLFNVCCAQTLMSPSSGNVNKGFWIANLFTRIVKN